MTLYDICNNVG